jgi:hypothetical protein
MNPDVKAVRFYLALQETERDIIEAPVDRIARILDDYELMVAALERMRGFGSVIARDTLLRIGKSEEKT